MRVFFGITVFVMHAVKNRICARIQKRRALCDKSKEVKEPFPWFIHGKHFMGAITVQKKSLTKK